MSWWTLGPVSESNPSFFLALNNLWFINLRQLGANCAFRCQTIHTKYLLLGGHPAICIAWLAPNDADMDFISHQRTHHWKPLKTGNDGGLWTWRLASACKGLSSDSSGTSLISRESLTKHVLTRHVLPWVLAEVGRRLLAFVRAWRQAIHSHYAWNLQSR